MTRQLYPTDAQTRGFTLIELMIVVVIVAILAAVAYPSYRHYVIKSRRADATISLSKIAQLLERCHTQTGAYNDKACAVGSSFPTTSDEDYYNIKATTLTASTYALQADPTSKGAQDDDTECNGFTLDEKGERGVTGTASVETCW